VAGLLLANLQRRRRQLQTLRRMLDSSEELATALQEILSKEPGRPDALEALALLEVRTDRIRKSIEEATSSSSSS
jgi:hypothetical protein